MAATAAAKPPSNQQAADGTYTYTGTATVTAGGSACVATSPAKIVGDAVVLSHGYGMLLHVTSSANTAAVLMDMKGSSPLVQYGHPAAGTASFVLAPQSTTYTAKFTIMPVKGTTPAVPFTATIDLAGPPLILGKKGACDISLALSFTPGVSKPLLKLLQGVL
jgi:hypothetical protein